MLVPAPAVVSKILRHLGGVDLRTRGGLSLVLAAALALGYLQALPVAVEAPPVVCTPLPRTMKGIAKGLNSVLSRTWGCVFIRTLLRIFNTPMTTCILRVQRVYFVYRLAVSPMSWRQSDKHRKAEVAHDTG